jgi:hypothetical protein
MYSNKNNTCHSTTKYKRPKYIYKHSNINQQTPSNLQTPYKSIKTTYKKCKPGVKHLTKEEANTLCFRDALEEREFD